MKVETKRALFAALCLLVLFTLVKHTSHLLPFGLQVGFFLAIAFQIFVPVWLIEKEGAKLADYKIGFLEFRSLNFKDIMGELKLVLWLVLIIFPIYLIGFHLWSKQIPIRFDPDPEFSWLNFILTQLLLVALAEEIFYRGFLQTQLLKAWPNTKVLFGIPIGMAVIVTNLFFALGHYVGDYNPGRLATFFPGLLFSFLAFRSKSVLGAVVFHALCNIFGQLLHIMYFWKI